MSAATIETREPFTAAKLQRDGYTYDQLSVTPAIIKDDMIGPELRRAEARLSNPSRTSADMKLARQEVERALRFTNELGAMLAVIANELAERDGDPS